MPRGIPAQGKRQIDPAHKPGRKPKLPPNTYQRSYRGTAEEHAELTAHLAKIRAAWARKRQQQQGEGEG